MTIRVPKWLAATLAIAIVAGAAFVIGRASESNDQSMAGNAGLPSEITAAESIEKEPEPEPDRLISFDAGIATTLDGLSLQTASLADAIEIFDQPTPKPRVRFGSLCPARWPDLGLRINFADLGEVAPCGERGNVGSVIIEGEVAVSAGWVTDGGAKLGMSASDVASLYPRMRPYRGFPLYELDDRVGDPYLLISRPNLYGDGRTPTLIGHLASDELVAFTMGVGAAGE